MIRRPRRPRAAFTLIELLVVIAIISALMTLSAAAVIKYVEIEQISDTQTVLDRTQSQLDKAWSKVKDQIYRETIHADTDQWIRTNLAGNDINATGRVRVLFVKLKLRQAFPMNFTEALYPPMGAAGQICPCAQLQPLPAYVQYLHSKGVQASSGLSWESSACLLMALQRGVSGAGINPEELTRGGAGGLDKNSFAVPILTDAWGNHIYFSRVPTGCPVLNPNGAQPGLNDTTDPQGYLQFAKWGTTYGPLFTSLTQQQLAPSNRSYKLSPMLASGGPDPRSQPGLDPVTFKPTPKGTPLFGKP